MVVAGFNDVESYFHQMTGFTGTQDQDLQRSIFQVSQFKTHNLNYRRLFRLNLQYTKFIELFRYAKTETTCW